MPQDTAVLSEADAASTQFQENNRRTIKVTLECAIDLALLRKQKRALISTTEGATITYEQEEAAEGMLNLLDFIQDSILEQGLATEDEIFFRQPQLFASEPLGLSTAA